MVWGWNGLGASSFSLIDKRSWRLMFEWVTINLHSAATLTGWLWVVGGLWCAAIAGWSLMKINCKFVWLTTMKIEQKNHQPSDLLLLLLLLHRSTNIFFFYASVAMTPVVLADRWLRGHGHTHRWPITPAPLPPPRLFTCSRLVSPLFLAFCLLDFHFN